MKKNWISWVLPGLAVLILDRIIKIAAEKGTLFSTLNSTTRNSGMAFGWLQGNTGLIVAGSLVLVAAWFFLLRGMRLKGLAPIAISMIVGGAAGNLFDRLAFGSVIDMFPFFGWFVFNVADVGVVAGAILCGFSLLFRPQDWSEK